MSFLKKVSPILSSQNGTLQLLQKRLQWCSGGQEVTTYPKQNKKCIEIKIPVPWGKIAAKWWGPIDKRPIVCIHGWQDNCNTYDGLIQFLPDNISYLAIDYPGHGLSSQIPPGMFYYPIELPVLLRRIHKYFGWPQMSILAHSLAANLSFLYASLFPNDVDFFVALDGIKPYSKEPGGFIDRTAENIELFLKYDTANSSGIEPPAYSLEEIAKRMYDANRGSIDMIKTEVLYKRATLPSVLHSNKYYFTRDPRLKANSIISWQNEDLKEYAKRVKCPMIVVRTTESKFVEKMHYLQEFVDLMKACNKDFSYVEFKGKHHAHLNEPENMAGIINDFILKYDKSSRDLGGIQPGLILNEVKT